MLGLRKIWIFTSALFVALVVTSLINSAFSSSNEAIWLEVKGAIGPATRDYLNRSLEKAAQEDKPLVVVSIDTPGGLDSSMRDIIQTMLGSSVPIVVYVMPSGARAASAGTYILYAAHIAAMAPATSIGAATPVQIGALPKVPKPTKQEEPDQGGAAGDPATMKHKIVNDAVAYIRGLAEMRGRNAEWAEKAVREASTLSASAALEKGAIDILATDMSDLLKQVNGRTVTVLGQQKTLDTAGLVLVRQAPDWRSNLLGVLTNPNVAYILMLVGIYGLIFEFSNPGAMVPGIVGAISLLLALYAFQLLPVNYAGFALMLLGIALIVAEAFVPSIGMLGIGGVIAFVIGSIILMDTDVPGFGVSLPLIGAFGLFSSALFGIVLVMAVKARQRPVVSGQEELVGAVAEVISNFDNKGKVHVHGEIWNACSHTPVRQGQQVRVIRMNGLTLWVEPITHQIEEDES